MPSPKRIDEFVEKIRIIWKEHPDFTFGKLVTFIFNQYSNHFSILNFMREDDDYWFICLTSLTEKEENEKV
jgi:hypothetical protein